MFSYGIKPLAFSEREYNKHRVGWVRSGCEKVNYFDNKIKRESCSSKNYYTLTFEFYFKEVDTVYFAPLYANLNMDSNINAAADAI